MAVCKKLKKLFFLQKKQNTIAARQTISLSTFGEKRCHEHYRAQLT